MKDFFISYNHADKHWAEWIAWQLESVEYKTVFQAWDFLPGSNFVLEMQNALTLSSRTILVLSPNYFRSAYTPSEWAAVFTHDPIGEMRRLVPVMVQQCMPQGLLKQLVYIDISGVTETIARSKLLEGVSLTRIKPKSPPKFPGRRGPKSRSLAEQPAFPKVTTVDTPEDTDEKMTANEPCLDDRVGETFLRNKLDAVIRPDLLNNLPTSILMIDVDGLTLINQHHGMRTGNHVLVTVARLLQEKKWILYSGRSGDDTFYAVVPRSTYDEACYLGEELLRDIQNYPWVNVSPGLRVTCCIGVAQFQLSEPAIDCVERAVIGFNKGKEEGRNKIEPGPLFIPPSPKGIMRKLSYSGGMCLPRHAEVDSESILAFVSNVRTSLAEINLDKRDIKQLNDDLNMIEVAAKSPNPNHCISFETLESIQRILATADRNEVSDILLEMLEGFL